jgi:hypothetical protein
MNIVLDWPKQRRIRILSVAGGFQVLFYQGQRTGVGGHEARLAAFALNSQMGYPSSRLTIVFNLQLGQFLSTSKTCTR